MATLVDRDRLQDLLRRGAQLIEVLPAREYAEDHLPGAISIPLRNVNRNATAALDRDRALVVYCWDMA